MKRSRVPLVDEFRIMGRIRDELSDVVGSGRQATEIAAVVEELYDRIDALDPPGLPGSPDFRWRLADQEVRSSLHITRDGRLLLGSPDDEAHREG